MPISLTDLSVEHQEALSWFSERSGTDIAWPQQLNGTFLVNKAKGIHKPVGWTHAVSVRKSLGSTYDDLLHWDTNGRWILNYAYEGTNPNHWTNEALRECMLDGVPVAVLIQTVPKPHPQYRVMGLASVTSENRDDRHFTLKQLSELSPQTTVETLDVALPNDDFIPPSGTDAKDRVMRAIAIRRGQPQFRRDLLTAYDGACAISGTRTSEVLEAAHIVAYNGRRTNHVQNGLLLRADIHTLFDLGLIRIDPQSYKIAVHDSVQDDQYRRYNGKTLRLPKRPGDQPSRASLTQLGDSEITSEGLKNKHD